MQEHAEVCREAVKPERNGHLAETSSAWKFKLSKFTWKFTWKYCL